MFSNRKPPERAESNFPFLIYEHGLRDVVEKIVIVVRPRLNQNFMMEINSRKIVLGKTAAARYSAGPQTIFLKVDER